MSEESGSLGVDEDSAFAGLVEFGEQHALPLSEKDFSVDDWNRYRWLARQELADMSVTVDELILLKVLGPNLVIVMLVIDISRHEALDGPSEVIEKTGF